MKIPVNIDVTFKAVNVETNKITLKYSGKIFSHSNLDIIKDDLIEPLLKMIQVDIEQNWDRDKHDKKLSGRSWYTSAKPGIAMYTDARRLFVIINGPQIEHRPPTLQELESLWARNLKP